MKNPFLCLLIDWRECCVIKEMVVISGKGGTGKTSIVASLAYLFDNKVLADCDVDAADLHLVLQPSTKKTNEFWCGVKAYNETEKCISCGICRDLCRFEAIDNNFQINPIACEGCGVCAHFCPSNAIILKECLAGHWYLSDTPYGTMIHAKLGTAQENSGKLVSLVRTEAKKIAEETNKPLIMVDGPPGTGCPVIASITGIDLALIVTEPTLSGFHDLERVLKLAKHFNVNTAVCINKHDINPQKTKEIIDYCQKENINIVGTVSYDNTITKAQIEGISVLEFDSHCNASLEIKEMAKNLKSLL